MECQCETCKTACRRRAGWFAPGEVAKAAAGMGLPAQDFFNKYVAVDYYIAEDEGGLMNPIFVLAPALGDIHPGQEYPFDCIGKCTFYQNELCLIHADKPNECRFYDHTVSNETASENRKKIVQAWKENQHEIEQYLGRKPEVPPPNLLEVLGFMMKDIKTKLGMDPDQSFLDLK